MIEHEYDHIFAGISHCDPIVNHEEAHCWQWVTLPEIAESLLRSPDTFTIWFHKIFEKFGVEGIRAWQEYAESSQ